FFFSSRRRHTRFSRDWSSDVCSSDLSGVLAFSRILNDAEVLVVANTNPTQGFQGEVIVDHELNPAGSAYKVLYSNKVARSPGGRSEERRVGKEWRSEGSTYQYKNKNT